MPNKVNEEKVIEVTLFLLIILMFISLIMNFNILDLGYLVILVAYFCKFLVLKGRD